MFFSVDILSKNKGPLGKIWLAANLSNSSSEKGLKLSKRDYSTVDVLQACENIANPSTPFALRLSSCLLLGVVRIHQKQTQYLYFDLKELHRRVRVAHNPAIDLPPANNKARFGAITLPDPVNNDLSFSLGDISIDIAIPDADYFLGLFDGAIPIPPTPSTQLGNCSIESSPFMADPKDITMSEDQGTPVDCLINVPGQNDFGEFSEEFAVPSGPMTLLDNVPMPVSNQQQSIDQPTQKPDCAGEMEGVLLFDDNTGAFAVHKDTEIKTPNNKDATVTPLQQPFVSPFDHTEARPTGSTQGRRFKTNAKRKLAFDKPTSLKEAAFMRDTSSTLRRKKMKLGRVKANDLLFQPACDDIRKSKVFMPLWKRGAVIETTTGGPLPGLGGLLMGDLAADGDQERMLEEGEEQHAISKSTSHIEGFRDHSQHRDVSYNISQEAASAFSDSSIANSARSRKKFSFNTSSATKNKGTSQFVPRPGLSPIPDVGSDMEITLEDYNPMLNLSDGDDDDHVPMQLGDGGDVRCTPFGNEAAGRSLHTPRTRSEPEEFYRHISGELKDGAVEFQQLLPQPATRKNASKCFANMLSLVSRGELRVNQAQPYGEIMLRKTDHS